jgi:hypothetical protein
MRFSSRTSCLVPLRCPFFLPFSSLPAFVSAPIRLETIATLPDSLSDRPDRISGPHSRPGL